MKRTFWIARRSGRIDQHGGIVGQSGCRGGKRAGGLEYVRQRRHAPSRVSDGDDALQSSGSVGHGAQFVEVRVICDRDARAAVGQAEAQRIFAKQREEWQDDCPEFHRRKMRHHNLGGLTEKDGNAVAFLYAPSLKGRCKSIGRVLELSVGPDLVAVIRSDVDDSRSVGVDTGPVVIASDGDIEDAGNPPSEAATDSAPVSRRERTSLLRKHKSRRWAGQLGTHSEL